MFCSGRAKCRCQSPSLCSQVFRPIIRLTRYRLGYTRMISPCYHLIVRSSVPRGLWGQRTAFVEVAFSLMFGRIVVGTKTLLLACIGRVSERGSIKVDSGKEILRRFGILFVIIRWVCYGFMIVFLILSKRHAHNADFMIRLTLYAVSV